MSEAAGWWLVVGVLGVYAVACWGLLVWQRRAIRKAFGRLDADIDSLTAHLDALIARLNGPNADGRGRTGPS
ncbi:hypothetical protein [Geodermatophilus obscurus]|uniref:Uncharacterized protein n=1 Tax=Geodermatophilus obscurus (strain ATCC 25078 / DSM 43160 / JCM 3152 / CCUG 61914 / KCC A-0152 / KCTC 9177 / NBRC 13315 / NRRL B-3577 / G-20) TaxID=526225 RepID=D2SB08_GEOOG|nr:hypothetical protein [Geodermatophilus obscurus]ADB76043.1 hypothetical protein Gobs_3442 [Geodermatophilus obscurus DSM 43160]